MSPLALRLPTCFWESVHTSRHPRRQRGSQRFSKNRRCSVRCLLVINFRSLCRARSVCWSGNPMRLSRWMVAEDLKATSLAPLRKDEPGPARGGRKLANRTCSQKAERPTVCSSGPWRQRQGPRKAHGAPPHGCTVGLPGAVSQLCHKLIKYGKMTYRLARFCSNLHGGESDTRPRSDHEDECRWASAGGVLHRDGCLSSSLRHPFCCQSHISSGSGAGHTGVTRPLTSCRNSQSPN